jgi:hypothetical protein
LSTSLRYEFSLAAAETVRANQVIARRSPMAWMQLAIWPILGFLALPYLLGGSSWRDLRLLFITGAFLALLQLAVPWLQRRQLRKVYAETPTLRGPQVYELDQAGLHIRGGSAVTSLGWDAVLEVLETKEGFLFFFAKQSGYLLPKRAVGDAAALAELRAFVRAMVGARAAGLADAPGVSAVRA